MARIIALGDTLTLYPGHGPATTIGRERLTNPVRASAPRGCAPEAMSAPAPEPLRTHAGWPAPVSALLLAAWLGASLYFTVVVTRAAFAVLPTRTLAGALVGQTLPVLFDTGMLVGALLVASALLSPRGAARTASLAGGVAIARLAAAARFVILARIARLRLSMPAAIDSLSARRSVTPRLRPAARDVGGRARTRDARRASSS